MQIHDLMIKDVELIAAGQSTQAAARKMLDRDIGFLPIHQGDRIIGVITDRDIAVRVVAAGKDPARTKVEDVMTEGAKYCYDDEDPDHVAGNMTEINVCRLPVMSRDKRLVGVVSIDDISFVPDPRSDRAATRRSGQTQRPG